MRPQRVPARNNQDMRDAIGSAVTARAYGCGEIKCFGRIVVPVAMTFDAS
jgi:hypothetical protein